VGAWDNSWETNAQPEVEAYCEQASAEWGGGWDDDDGWNAEESNAFALSFFAMIKSRPRRQQIS